MKKSIILVGFILLFFLFIAKTIAIPNPWIECNDDINCAAKKAGFNFPLRVENYKAKAMDNMIEIEFPINKFFKKIITVRKSVLCKTGYDKDGFCDISGVYNNYPVNRTITLKNGVNFKTRGDKNKFYVALFDAESGYYGFYCEKGMNKRNLEYFYKILEEAEAPRHTFDEKAGMSIEQLMDLRRIDDIVEPVFTQDCFPRTLMKKGVTKVCFERANLGEDSFCSASEVKMIKEYYAKGQDKDPLNYPNNSTNESFCAD